MIDGRLTGQHALVVTPFLPLPADAGQRKRVHQFHELLRKAGCHITLLHYAVEQPFIWAHHEGIDRSVAAMVDELITVQAGPSFGQPPLANGAHRLDEWWDPLFAETVQRLFSKRWFDIVVVNNVWLTKVFDHVPPGVARIVETHDVFSERIRALRAIGQPADFFVCELSDEAFGWSRADVVVAISDAEQVSISAAVDGPTVLALPYAETMQEARRRNYVHPEKVVFGFFGSGHPFNIQGLKALISSLAVVGRWAPVELVIAGEVGKTLTPDELAHVKDLGYVKSPEDFYDAIDIFVSPLDFGSGLKIKVVEAISLGVPTLVTEHSAIGTGLDPRLVVRNVEVLAEAMATIAHNRPDMGAFAQALAKSQSTLACSVAAGASQLADAIGIHQHRTIVRYQDLTLPTSHPRLWALVGLIRELGNRGPVIVDLGHDAIEPSWLRLLHPRIKLLGDPDEGLATPNGNSRSRLPRHRLDSDLNLQIVFSDDAHYRVARAAVHVHDARWRDGPIPAQATHVIEADGRFRSTEASASVARCPWWSDSITWDPVLPKPLKERGARWVAVVAHDADSGGLQVLAALASHGAAMPVRVFDTGGAPWPIELLRQMRADPPAAVVELAMPSRRSAMAQWCDISRIPYGCSLAARDVLELVAGCPFVEPLPIHLQWREMLEKLYSGL